MFCFFSRSHKFFSLHSYGFRKAQGTFLALIWGNYYMQENLPHAATSLKSLSSYLGGLRSGSCDDLLKHQSSVLDALPVDAVNLLRAQKHKWDISTASSLRGNISSEWENHTSLMRMMMYLATSCKQMLTKQGGCVSGRLSKSPVICSWLTATAARFSASLFWQDTWPNVQQEKMITALMAPQRFNRAFKNRKQAFPGSRESWVCVSVRDLTHFCDCDCV